MLTKFLKKGCIKNNKGGFSLVELIVVIAIMAVMAAVLAPALLGYVEKSRMQKDDSAMSEVVSAMRLSLADQEIYDEIIEHSVWDNVSCYIDKQDETAFSDYKISLKAANGDKKEQYMFGDEARLLDETIYYAAGNMRGLTITWSPTGGNETYDFSTGVLNKFVGRKTGLLSENPELYNNLRSVIGDKLNTTSQTYRNSDYTVFIRIGSTGGAEATQQDAIQVWGQFNGTNLPEIDSRYELSTGRIVGTAGQNDSYVNKKGNQNGNFNFSEIKEIKTMTIDGVEYHYEDGMTWGEWFTSQYNTQPTDEYTYYPNSLRRIKNGSEDPESLRFGYELNWYNERTGLYEGSESDFISTNHFILPTAYYYQDIWYFPGMLDEDTTPYIARDGYIYIYVDSQIEQKLPSDFQ